MTTHAPKKSRSRGLTRRVTDPRVVFAASIIVGLAVSAYAGRMPAWVPFAYLVGSVVTFIAYGIDKRSAEAGEWRISEAALHLLDLLFGWPGGLAAQQFYSHKTRKVWFQIVFWLTGLLHLVCWAYVITQTTLLR